MKLYLPMIEKFNLLVEGTFTELQQTALKVRVNTKNYI